MKKVLLILTIFMSIGVFCHSQIVPTHPEYVKYGASEDFITWFENWQPGVELNDDDAFYISRIRIKDRLINSQTQVNPALSTDRKMCSWQPVGTLDKKWKQIPRYNMNGDNFNMWQYLDIQGNWGNGWFRVPAGYSNAAHKNGVKTGCIMFMEWAEGIRSPAQTHNAKIIEYLMTKNSDGTFKNSSKLIQYLKYYGIDGFGINGEGRWSQAYAVQFQDFLRDLHIKAAEQDYPQFHVDWYDCVPNDGGLSFGGNQLDNNRKDWFYKNNEYVTDMFMLNYNIEYQSMPTSAYTAKSIGADPFKVFAGFYCGGRGLSSSKTGFESGGWHILKNTDISIAFWGEHGANNIYKKSDEFGSDDITMQETYLRKLERVFTGGTRNSASTPNITNTVYTLDEADMERFHGISKLLPARSTISEMPFVTRFSLGNGMYFAENGDTTFASKWYNLGIQDYLPSWRWWVVDDSNNVPIDAIKANMCFDEAWFAGSSLRLNGATAKSHVNLFKTELDVEASTQFSISYKLKSGVATHMKIRMCKVGSEGSFVSVPVTSGLEGEYNKFTFNLSDHGFVTGDKIAMIGVTVEGTSEDYEINIGEMSLLNIEQEFNPATPQITKSEVLKETRDEVSFKLFWDSKPTAPENTIVYNDEVDTWYYEILIQDANQPIRLLNAVTEWAAYVVDAPINLDNVNYKIGVRAVAPDGITKSEISWITKEKNPTFKTDFSVSRKYINEGQEVTLSIFDDLVTDATWTLTSVDNEIIVNGTNVSVTIDEVGSYDLKVEMSNDSQSEEFMNSSMVEVLPLGRGCSPLANFDASNKDLIQGESSNLFLEGILGEGNVSQGLSLPVGKHFNALDDAIQNVTPFGYSLWFKLDELPEGTDFARVLYKRQLHYKKRSYSVRVNAFGDLQFFSYSKVATVPSAQTVPNVKIVPGTWYFIACTYTGSTLNFYLNGQHVLNIVRGLNFHNVNQWIGAGDLAFSGSIDEFKVYDQILTNDEVIGEMNRTVDLTAKTACYWSFDEEVNLNIPDQIGTAYVGRTYEWGTGIEVKVENTFAPGCPYLVGNYPITSTIKWSSYLNQIDEDDVLTSTEESPTFQYQEIGDHNVRLDISNVYGQSSETKEDFIVVNGDLITSDQSFKGTLDVSNVSVLPNPVINGTINLKVNSLKNGIYTYSLYDLSGSMMDTWQENCQTGLNESKKVLSSDIVPGMYILSIKTNDKSFTRKIVIK